MCCGDKRSQIQANQPPAQSKPPIYYQYTGTTGLTVIGRETQKRYRFDQSGSVVAVDANDAYAMKWVPHLRKLGEFPDRIAEGL